jgi:hypothetical protein
MLFRRTLCLGSLFFIALNLLSCAGKTQFRESCASETDAAWHELSIAKAKGFGGTLSYTKALGTLTAARTMQSVENFDACYHNAKKARSYIHNSYKGQ